jgi:hypothetical protein
VLRIRRHDAGADHHRAFAGRAVAHLLPQEFPVRQPGLVDSPIAASARRSNGARSTAAARSRPATPSPACSPCRAPDQPDARRLPAQQHGILYGSDPTTFNYVAFNTGLGALPRSAQNLFDTFVMDDLGVITLRTTQNWGNFLPSTLTKNILPFIVQERTKLIASSVNAPRASTGYSSATATGSG